jgi:hypothetical protein
LPAKAGVKERARACFGLGDTGPGNMGGEIPANT